MRDPHATANRELNGVKKANKINGIGSRQSPSPSPRAVSRQSTWENDALSPAWHDNAFQDMLVNRVCDKLTTTLKQDMTRVIQEGMGHLEAQQTFLMEQQSVFMKAIVEHIQGLAVRVEAQPDLMPQIDLDQEYPVPAVEPELYMDNADSCADPTSRSVVQPSTKLVSNQSDAAEEQVKQSDRQPVKMIKPSNTMDSIGNEAPSSMTYSSACAEFERGEDGRRDGGLHEYKKAMVRQIPDKHLRHIVISIIDFAASIQEPLRTGTLADIVDGKVFFSLSLFFILCDQCITVAATNYHANVLDEVDAAEPNAYRTLERVFLGWFIFELAVKICVHRVYTFFGSEHWKMNWFDLFLVVLSAVEVSGIRLGFLRAIRLFKAAKVVRMLKALAQVRDLRIMLDCLINSWFAMFWAIVLVGFLTYMFALIFVQFMTEYLISHGDAVDPLVKEDIRVKFGSVEQGILTLFMSLTGGFDWGELYTVIVLNGWLGTTVLVFYVILFTVSVWNIVGSIFVEKVMETAKPHPHEIFIAQRTQAKADAKEMRTFFEDFDANEDKLVEESEWINMVEHGLSEFLTSREVDLKDRSDAEAFFSLAREDYRRKHPEFIASAGVPLTSLIATFLRVKGPATSLDVAIMQHNVTVRQNKILKGEGAKSEALADETILY